MAKYVSEDGVKAIRDWVKVHDNKSLYNLGYYDTITENDDGTYTITRQTGYITINTEDITGGSTTGVNASGAYTYKIDRKLNSFYEWDKIIGISNNEYKIKCISTYWVRPNEIGIITNDAISIGFETQKTQAQIQALCPISIQYKLATSYTEKVEKNHYAVYNQRFILDHNKSEAERSSNIKELNYNNTENGINLSIVNNKFTISGTNTKNEDLMIYNINLNAGTYTISIQNVSGTSSDNFRLVVHDHDWTYQRTVYFNTSSFATFTINPDITTPLFLQVYGPAIGNTINCSGYIMLNEGTEPLPYQPYEGKVVHEKGLGNYVTTDTAQTITGYKKISSIGIDTINGATLGNAIVRQNTSTGEVILGSTVRPLRLWGNQTRPSYSKNDGASYSDLALLSDVPSIYGVSQLYRHDIEFDILNGDGIKCTFWSTSNEKINDFSQIPYLAFSNIQVKNISNEKILNVVQWNSDGFRFYESDGTSTLIGDGYDGVTAYYINGEPQL